MKASLPFPAVLLLVPLAACVLTPAEQPSQQATDAATPSAMDDAATGNAPAPDASAPTAPSSSDAGLSTDASAPEAGSFEAGSADASGGDAQAADAGLGCPSRCLDGGLCPEEPGLLAFAPPRRCGVPPTPPAPPSPPETCTSATTAVPGYCGAYACKLTTNSFAAAFNASGKCANAREFMCAGTIHAIAFQCMIDNALAAKAPEATALCIKSNPSVAASHIGDACVGCFVTAHECCKKNEQCLATCIRETGKACDDAQRAAGCVAPLFACTGMPSPF